MSLFRRVREDVARRPDRWARWILSVAAGAVFLLFGAAKFTAHEQKILAPYFAHGLLSPAYVLLGAKTLSICLGVAEVGLGLLLISGRLPRLAGLALAAFAVGTLSMLVLKPPAAATAGHTISPGFFFKDIMLLALGIALALGFGKAPPRRD